MTRTIKEAREHIAKLAEADGELNFAREVRAGCWDHRRDVQNALKEPLKARHCAFCGKPMGCFAYALKVLEALGGEKGNSYAHLECLKKAKRNAK